MFDFKFNWKPEMEINIESVDTQHKQLFTYGRDIEQAIKINCIGVTDEQLVDIVCHLREYASYNTYEEEKIMSEMNYPLMKEHLEEHNQFMQDIMKINLASLKEEPVENLKEIQGIIVSFVFQHILTDDMKMGKAYNEYLDHQAKKSLGEKIEIRKEETGKEKLFGYKICNLDVSEIYLYKNQSRLGEVVVVYRDKVHKLTKLNALARSSYFGDLARVAKLIEERFDPDGMEYVAVEDYENYLAFHIIPKRRTDTDWGVQSMICDNIETMSTVEAKEMVAMLDKLFSY